MPTLLSNSHPRKPHDRFLFGELYFSLISSIAKVETEDISGGLSDFKRAYELFFGGVFEMFFIEMGKNLHPLLNDMYQGLSREEIAENRYLSINTAKKSSSRFFSSLTQTTPQARFALR